MCIYRALDRAASGCGLGAPNWCCMAVNACVLPKINRKASVDLLRVMRVCICATGKGKNGVSMYLSGITHGGRLYDTIGILRV